MLPPTNGKAQYCNFKKKTQNTGAAWKDTDDVCEE